MKALLQLLLVAYYTDFKRSTSARITRDIDKQIRFIVDADPKVAVEVINCKKVAEAIKRQVRDTAKQRDRHNRMYGKGGIQHVPCRQPKK